MSSDEKKFKLDELPDQGSEPEFKAPPPPKFQKPEPRIEKIKKLSGREQVEALGQRWYFDKPIRSWTWVIPVVVLLIIEKMKLYDPNSAARRAAYQASQGLSEFAFVGFEMFDFLFIHPIIFAVLIPFIFKFSKPSKFFFEVTFGGIISVRKVMPGSLLEPKRVTVGWDDIKQVTNAKVGERDILILHDAQGPVAELIWDIEDVKKKVIKQVVKGLVSAKNPFREFLEKEVA